MHPTGIETAGGRESGAAPEFGTPRPWAVLALGTFHEHVILVVILSAAAPIFALWAAGPDALPGWVELLLVALALAMISGLGRHLVAAPVARALKRLWTRAFRVLYFRSFDPGASHQARDSLSPILGGMGTLTTVHDHDFIQGFSRPEGHVEHEALWFAWLEIGEILSNALEAPHFRDETWRDEVLELLRRADLVVLDVTRAGENLAWELRRALEVLPPERVITLCEVDAVSPLEAEDAIEYELSRTGRWRLRWALHRRLRQIAD